MLKHRICGAVYLVIITLFISCSDKVVNDQKATYLHLGHIRTENPGEESVNPYLFDIDYSDFDMLLLGGDLTANSSLADSTLVYLDNLFDLDDANTHWILGNHDIGNIDKALTYTKRPEFYSFHKNDITFLVLNSQKESPGDCKIRQDQIDLIKSVTDTISESSHLVVLSHKLLWLAGHENLKKHVGKGKWDWACNYRLDHSNWNIDIRPMLEHVQKKTDVKVICIAGDIGNNARSFEEKSKSGIIYLASGLSLTDMPSSKILILNHNITTGKLSWKFKNLIEYVSRQKKITQNKQETQ